MRQLLLSFFALLLHCTASAQIPTPGIPLDHFVDSLRGRYLYSETFEFGGKGRDAHFGTCKAFAPFRIGDLEGVLLASIKRDTINHIDSVTSYTWFKGEPISNGELTILLAQSPSSPVSRWAVTMRSNVTASEFEALAGSISQVLGSDLRKYNFSQWITTDVFNLHFEPVGYVQFDAIHDLRLVRQCKEQAQLWLTKGRPGSRP